MNNNTQTKSYQIVNVSLGSFQYCYFPSFLFCEATKTIIVFFFLVCLRTQETEAGLGYLAHCACSAFKILYFSTAFLHYTKTSTILE